MKKINIPSILKFAQSIALLLIISAAVAFSFTVQSVVVDGEAHKFFSVLPMVFLSFIALNLVFGPVMARYNNAVFKNDSLVVSDTTYAGTFAPYFILPATFGMNTVEKGLVYVKDGIKKTHTIGKLDFDKPLQPRVANPTTSGGNITITGNTLTPADIMLYQEFNPRDLEAHFVSEEMSAKLLERQLPVSVENYITMLVVQRAFEQFEIGMWMGSTDFSAAADTDPEYQYQFFDGFLKRMIADSAIYSVGSPSAITSSNVDDALQDLLELVAVNNKAMLARADRYSKMKFICSINTAVLYEEFLTTSTYKNNDTTEAGINKYKGYEIVPVAGMADDTILFTDALAGTEGNLWLGMNSILDENFQLARVNAANELFFLKMLMKMDVNYGFSNKVFLYTTLVAADFEI